MQCLDSALNQTLPFFEIILIDDDSTDNTYEIWKKFYEGCGVRYEKTAYHSQIQARNHGFRMSSGDFLVFLDADDWLLPDYHQKMRTEILKDPQIGFVYCGFHITRESSDVAWFLSQKYICRDFDFKRLWLWNYCSVASIIRREAWCGEEKIYGYIMENGRAYGEDWDVWYTIASKGWKLKLVPEYLFHYRIHGQNTSRPALEDPRTTLRAGWAIKQQYLAYDLTILLLHTGRRQTLERSLDFVRRLQKPAATQVIVIDATPRAAKPGIARPDCTDYVVLPFEKTFADWRRKAILEARYHARGKKVLILSDRVSYSEDLYEKLRNGMEEAQAAIYSPRIFDESYERVLAWRAVEGKINQGLHFVPAGRRKKRVFAAGLDGTLMTAYAFHTFNIHPDAKKHPYVFLEALLGDWASENNLRWFIDGSIRSLRERRYRLPADRPPVSIIIPVRNGKKSLPRLLKSLEDVDYPKEKIEVLVVDNNSTDKTPEIVAGSFSFVKVLHETKQSSYAARNKGIRESRHDLIAFLDADCEVTPLWLKELVEEILEYPWVGAAAGDNRPKNGKPLLSYFERKRSGYQNFQGNEKFPAYGITMNMIFRRQVFNEIGLFDDSEISGSDADMSWRLQFESSWRLKIVMEKAWVIHEDVVKPLEWFKRQMRIGHGMYGLYQKHPSYLSYSFYWFPRKKIELLVHFLRDAVKLTARRLKEDGWSWRESLFVELRTFAQKLGYRRAFLEKFKDEKKLPSSQSFKIMLGEKYFETNHYDYKSLRREADSGTAVLYSEPSVYNYKNPFLQYLFSLAGLTTLWHWRPRLFSLEFWDLIPFCRHFKFLEQKNLEWNVKRFRKALGMRKEDSCRLSGHSAWPVLERWKKALGENTVLEPYRKLPDLSFMTAPVAVCFLNSLWSPEIIRACDEIASFSPWPVIVGGSFSTESEKADLHQYTIRNPNLYFFEIKNDADARALLNLAGVCLFASAQEFEKIHSLSKIEAPVFVKHEEDKNLEKWVREIRASFCYPSWPLPKTTINAESPAARDSVTV